MRRAGEERRKNWKHALWQSLSANVCASRVRTAKEGCRPLHEGFCVRRCMCGVMRDLKWECKLHGSTVGTA